MRRLVKAHMKVAEMQWLGKREVVHYDVRGGWEAFGVKVQPWWQVSRYT